MNDNELKTFTLSFEVKGIHTESVKASSFKEAKELALGKIKEQGFSNLENIQIGNCKTLTKI